MKKRLLCILLAFTVLIGSVGIGTLTAYALNDDIAVTGATRYGRDEFVYYRSEEDHSAEIIDYDTDDSSSVTELIIPSSLDGYTVKKIGKSAFERNWTIESVSVPDTVIEIGAYAFYNCASLKKVTLGNSVESIRTYAFAHCPLEEIDFPDSLAGIGSLAFTDTPWYDSQPDGLVYAGNALYTAKNYYPQTLEIAPGTKGIGDSAFYNHSSLKSVVIPDSVSYLGNSAFEGCLSLTTVNIPDAVTAIYSETFYQCTSLPEITLPDGITSIGANAFCGCESLRKVNIPDSVSSIGSYAFSSCGALTEVNIPASVHEISYLVFRGCSSLTKITVDIRNPYYDSREDCNALIETATNTLIAGCDNSFIPATVRAIDRFAFYKCGFTSITIPNSVTSIGEKAFYDCTSLNSVTVPASVTSIGNYAIGYYYGIVYQSKWVTEYGEKKMSGFTVKGYNDTEAQRYAQSKNLTFISLGEKPTEAPTDAPTEAPTQPPTDAPTEPPTQAPTEAPVLLGDADGNGEVDAIDATLLQRHATMIAVPFDEKQLMNADIDGDGELTIVDATFIQRYATHIKTPYPVGEPIT